MTDTGLQEIILDGPLHQVVIDRCPANSLVVFDGLVVVAFERRQISHLQVMLVCKTARDVNNGTKPVVFLNLTLQRCPLQTTQQPSRMPQQPASYLPVPPHRPRPNIAAV